MTNRIISNLSYGETDFNKAKITYKMPIKKSGYQTTLKFEEPFQNTTWNRNRKVIWFNPPFILNVMINIGKEFFKLIPKHFPRNHSFRKILNPNLIKISYSSMDKYDKILLNNTMQGFWRTDNIQKKDHAIVALRTIVP